MKNPRELKVENEIVFEKVLVPSSMTGRETIMCFGDWNGANVEIQTQLEVDGEYSAVTTLPENGSHTENFALELNVGYKNPVIVSVSGSNTAKLFIKVVTAEV